MEDLPASWKGRLEKLTQINTVSAQLLQTRLAFFPAVLGRAVDPLEFEVSIHDNSKFGRKEDIISLSGALEPLAYYFLHVTIYALAC